ncbi:MAG: ATP-binding cassette domain-containing protein [Rhizobiaceae bacterium]|nr:ATP-binding cassette domain-containing protein [Rhizobiaceae bacterium]
MSTAEPDNVLLSIRHAAKAFGGVHAIDDVSLDLRAGIVTTLVGPNGAGKTTLFNLITGHLVPDGGTVRWLDKDLIGVAPHNIARMGIARTFQDLRLFDHMSVEDNLLTAIEPTILPFGAGSLTRAEKKERLNRILDRTGLTQRRSARSIDLAYAERKFLSLGRAMITNAKLWLLDEPASGLDRSSYDRFLDILRDAVSAGVTICIIEHNLDIVVGISDRIAFLDRGRLLADDEPKKVLSNPELAAIYFGDRKT